MKRSPRRTASKKGIICGPKKPIPAVCWGDEEHQRQDSGFCDSHADKSELSLSKLESALTQLIEMAESARTDVREKFGKLLEHRLQVK
jgi:hypothetical protein